MSFSGALEKLWWRREESLPARLALSPLSFCALGYAAGAALLRARAQPLRASLPVISVGNLCVGGSGKTPVALFLCERLLARGERPALLSRGHGGTGVGGVTVVCAGQGPLVSAEVAGDEPLLVAQRCPRLFVLAGKRRVLLAAEAARLGATVLVLDDGLQHHALARDLDVIVVDARNPLGNGRLLPRGPLREPPAALSRVAGRGLLWLTGAGLSGSDGTGADLATDPQLDALLALARSFGLRGPVESTLVARASDLHSASVFLLSGIARPERFAAQVRALGATVLGEARFADHHLFTAAELRRVRSRATALGAVRIVTTEKDLVRIQTSLRAGTPPIEALPVAVGLLRGEDQLDAALDLVTAGHDRGIA